MSLAKFDDLPQELVEALGKCQALVRLDLESTNLTLKDVINVLECIKLKVLTIPGTFHLWKLMFVTKFNTIFFIAINGMTADSLSKVLSFSSVKDLDISKAALSHDEMTTVLENASVQRLYLNEIESLDIDMIKAFVQRNKQVTCLSLRRTSVKEKDLMEFFPPLHHDTLQVLILPSGTKLLFSGDNLWTTATHITKLPNSSRVEMRLNSTGIRVRSTNSEPTTQVLMKHISFRTAKYLLL